MNGLLVEVDGCDDVRPAPATVAPVREKRADSPTDSNPLPIRRPLRSVREPLLLLDGDDEDADGPDGPDDGPSDKSFLIRFN